MRNRYAEYNSCFDNMIRLKYVAQALNGDRSSNYPSSDDFFKQGVPFINSPAIENGKIDTNELLFISREKYDSMRGVKLRRDDILYCLRGDVGKNAMSDYDVGTIASALMVIRVQKDKYVPKFLFYVLNSQLEKDQRDRTTTGAVASNLSAENVMNFFVPHLPINEQLRLCHFLDSRVSTTDTVLENYTDQLSMLTRYKRELIAKCVTKGLDKSAPMKPSGEDWIGDVPEHWRIQPLFSVAKENKEKNISLSCDNLLSLSYGNIIRKDINSNYGLLPASFESYQVVQKGYTVLRLTDLQNDQCSLRTGYVEEKGIITSAYLALIPSTEMDSKYFHYLLHAFDLIKVFYGLGSGLRQTLNFNDFKHLRVLMPPVEEQERIAAYLDEKIRQIDAAVADITSQIQKLKDYRRILIHDAVTGKIKI